MSLFNIIGVFMIIVTILAVLALIAAVISNVYIATHKDKLDSKGAVYIGKFEITHTHASSIAALIFGLILGVGTSYLCLSSKSSKTEINDFTVQAYLEPTETKLFESSTAMYYKVTDNDGNEYKVSATNTDVGDSNLFIVNTMTFGHDVLTSYDLTLTQEMIEGLQPKSETIGVSK